MKLTIDTMYELKTGWPRGIYHFAPKSVTNWYEIAKTLIAYAEQQRVRLNTQVADIQAIKTAEYPTAAKRPLNSQLDTSKLGAQLSFDLPH